MASVKMIADGYICFNIRGRLLKTLETQKYILTLRKSFGNIFCLRDFSRFKIAINGYIFRFTSPFRFSCRVLELHHAQSVLNLIYNDFGAYLQKDQLSIFTSGKYVRTVNLEYLKKSLTTDNIIFGAYSPISNSLYAYHSKSKLTIISSSHEFTIRNIRSIRVLSLILRIFRSIFKCENRVRSEPKYVVTQTCNCFVKLKHQRKTYRRIWYCDVPKCSLKMMKYRYPQEV